MADTNSVSAIVQNGEVTNLTDKTKSTNETPKGYDKDSFLKILVAQMKYQDPMEPTSNTEYISQYLLESHCIFFYCKLQQSYRKYLMILVDNI